MKTYLLLPMMFLACNPPAQSALEHLRDAYGLECSATPEAMRFCAIPGGNIGALYEPPSACDPETCEVFADCAIVDGSVTEDCLFVVP